MQAVEWRSCVPEETKHAQGIDLGIRYFRPTQPGDQISPLEDQIVRRARIKSSVSKIVHN
jgi:hypothetical protein